MAHYHSPGGKANKPQRKRRQTILGIETAKRVRVATPDGFYHMIQTEGGYRMPGDNDTLYVSGEVIIPKGDYIQKGAYPIIREFSGSSKEIPPDYLRLPFLENPKKTACAKKDYIEEWVKRGIIKYEGGQPFFVPPESRVKSKY